MGRFGKVVYGIIFFSIASIFTVQARELSGIGIEELSDILVEQTGVADNQLALSKIKTVLSTLTKKQKQYKREHDFIEYLYYFTHRKLFKNYSQYPSLSETLTSGAYDCLTASAIYSILLNELGVPHSVVETNYHIYILVYPDSDEEIILETTDPIYGFVDSKQAIADKKQTYIDANNVLNPGQVDMNLSIARRLQGKELVGLLYYNQSIKELNNGAWQKAASLAAKADKYYPNLRVDKLLNYINTSFRAASL